MADAPELVSDLPLSSEPVDGRAFGPLVPFSSPSSGRSETRCLWCGQKFKPRATGGSAQKFCSAGHRNAFWTAARRWTLRAVETGLLVDRVSEGDQDERARSGRGYPSPRGSQSAAVLNPSGSTSTLPRCWK